MSIATEIKSAVLARAQVIRAAGEAEAASFLENLVDTVDMNSKVYGHSADIATYRMIFGQTFGFEREWRPAAVISRAEAVISEILAGLED